jgi:hypothetical protein
MNTHSLSKRNSLPTLIGLATLGTLLAASPSAFAQGSSGGVGGGGDQLVCTRNGVTTYELLDLVEGSSPLPHDLIPFELDLAPQGTLAQTYAAALVRLSQVDPERAETYLKRGLEIIQDLETLRANPNAETRLVLSAPIQIADIDDEDQVYDYAEIGCPNSSKVQMVRQDQINGVTIFTFNLQLLNRMNPVHQTATILHEVVYEEMRLQGATQSRLARAFVRMILSKRLDTLSLCEYMKKVELLQVKQTPILIGKTSITSPQLECSNPAQAKSKNIQNIHFNDISIQNAGFSLHRNRSWSSLSGAYSGRGDYQQIFPIELINWIKDRNKSKLKTPNTFSQVWNDNGSQEIWLGDCHPRAEPCPFTPRQDEWFHFVTVPGDLKLVQSSTHQAITVPSEVEQVLSDFFTKIKDQLELRNPEEAKRQKVLYLVDQIRFVLGKKDWRQVETLARSGSDLNSVQIPANFIPTLSGQEFTHSLLSLRSLSCKVTTSGFSFALGFGTKAESIRAKCLMSNGDEYVFARRAQIAMSVGIGINIGTSFSKPEVSIQNVTHAEPQARIENAVASSALGLLYARSDDHGETLKFKLAPRVGLFIAIHEGAYESKLKFRKRIHNNDLLIQTLLSQIPTENP